MMNVQFEEENSRSFKSRTIPGEFQTPKMIKLLMKAGFKDEEKAGKFLFYMMIFNFIVAGCLVIYFII